MVQYLIIPSIIVVLALAFLEPVKSQLPFAMQCLILGLLFLATATYALLIFKERARDERERTIRAQADRIACLVGMGFLVMVIGYRLLVDQIIYPEIIVALVVMVLVKVAMYWYSEHHM